MAEAQAAHTNYFEQMLRRPLLSSKELHINLFSQNAAHATPISAAQITILKQNAAQNKCKLLHTAHTHF